MTLIDQVAASVSFARTGNERVVLEQCTSGALYLYSIHFAICGTKYQAHQDGYHAPDNPTDKGGVSCRAHVGERACKAPVKSDLEISTKPPVGTRPEAPLETHTRL